LRYRISFPARADLTNILKTSLENWGEDARARYAALLLHAMGQVAAAPQGPLTRDRGELAPRVRSFHLRHARSGTSQAGVSRPVHVLYYRVRQKDVVEIVRILHERMEPGRHIG
jgi:toxin ParE1/3/4